MHPLIQQMFKSILQNNPLDEAMVEGLLPLLPHQSQDIFALGRLAASQGGVKTFTCGIINAKSGRCSENCSFCAQSRYHNTPSPVHARVATDVLVRRAEQLVAEGAAYMGIVTSGGTLAEKDFTALCEAAQKIRANVAIQLCASFGLLSAERARALKQAGYTSYHHNIETAPSYYENICTTHSISRRFESVRVAKAAGLRVCCGGIFGMGETWQHRLEFAQTLAELDVDAIPINFLIPVAGTPLQHKELLPAHEALAIIAIVRLLHPRRDIIVCGGRPQVLQNMAHAVLFAGANGVMVGEYLTMPGSSVTADAFMLAALGGR